MSVRIITDSTCDLPTEIIHSLGIYVVPIYIHIGNIDLLDGIDISREEFYQNMPEYIEQPSTAVPSPAKFRAMYDALAESGATEVLSIHISSTLSAIVDVAKKAAQDTSSVQVTVFDSRQLSLGMGFLVQTAAELALSGCTVTEIIPVLEDQIKRTHVSALLGTLKYLRRSGRMNRAISTIGEIIQIKPILKMYNGISGVEKIRTYQKAISRLSEMLKTCLPFEKIAFLHSGALDAANFLMVEIRHHLPEKEIWLELINPVLGAHLGPGVIGFACVTSK